MSLNTASTLNTAISSIAAGTISKKSDEGSERPVVRCTVCNLVQYNTRTGNCRRCLQALPVRMEHGSALKKVIASLPAQTPDTSVVPVEKPMSWKDIELIALHVPLGDNQELPNEFIVERERRHRISANNKAVLEIGTRIREFRELHGETQSQIHDRSTVSRSYLSRVEFGRMTPAVETLERLAEVFDVPIKAFFSSEPLIDLRDPFMFGIFKHLHILREEDWREILLILEELSTSSST